MSSSERALDTEAVAPHRFEMRSARDEVHLLPRLGEPRAKVAAHAARAHYCDLHRCLLIIAQAQPQGRAASSVASRPRIAVRPQRAIVRSVSASMFQRTASTPSLPPTASPWR